MLPEEPFPKVGVLPQYRGSRGREEREKREREERERREREREEREREEREKREREILMLKIELIFPLITL